jgi:O-glycosyl hydrolase
VLTQKSAELFYSKNGLNLNIMRYNIGGGDAPDHKHITRTDSLMPGWLEYDKISDEYVYNYEADTNQLNVLKACYDATETPYIEVFSNSPPYFMTKSGCSSGGEDPNKNNLKDDCYEWFAEYLANVTEYINNTLNLKVNSISPMNEPNTDYWKYLSEKQEGCHFDSGENQNKILLLTAKAINTGTIAAPTIA